MASWFSFPGIRPERKDKAPKMPSTSIILYAPYTADKMVSAYIDYHRNKNKIKKKAMPHYPPPRPPKSKKNKNIQTVVLAVSAELWNKYLEIPDSEKHPSDNNDVLFHIHAIQNILYTQLYKKRVQ